MAGLRLVPNEGQWDRQVRFQADLSGARLYVADRELIFLFYDADKLRSIQHSHPASDSVAAHIVRMRFTGASENAVYLGREPWPDRINYYKGNDPAKWKTGISPYRNLLIKDLYPGIDFELLESGNKLKYNFIVKPGGDPSGITIEYEGVENPRLQDGRFIYSCRFGSITELEPLVYESSEDGRKVIPASYQLDGNVLSFRLHSKRNMHRNLIIDPVLVFSTYSGSDADNFGYTATFDSEGHAYAGGTVFDFGFPVTSGAFQLVFSGGESELPLIGYIERDCGIMKFSADGKQLLFSTYIGGTVSNEQPHSMIVDKTGNLLIMGTTKSPDFPIGIAPAFDDSHNGLSDIFVVRISKDGSSLLNGTFVGGSGFDGLNGDRPSGSITPLLYNYADDFRGEIILDTNDNVYVASSTSSSDFPVLNAFDATMNGMQDGCVFILDSDLSTMLFSSYIGGNSDDASYGLDMGTSNDLYVTGGSNSAQLRYDHLNYAVGGMRKDRFGGRADGILHRISLDDYRLLAATFIGTTGYEQCYFVKTDKYGKPFVYGQTDGDHNASPGVYANQRGRMFLKKLNPDLNGIELETTFGAMNKTRPDLSPTALLVDECERVFISGWGAINFTSEFIGGGTHNMPLTPDAYQKTTDGYDFYLAVFGKNFSELQYATYFGGRSNGITDAHEHVDGGTSRFDKKGIIYQSVCAGCGGQSLFPTTPGVWSNANNSNNCNNAIFKFDFENLNRKPSALDSMYDVLATDTLDFYILVSDPDQNDSLKLVLTGDPFTDPAFPLPLPEIVTIEKQAPGNTVKAHVKWNPGCIHANRDTVKLKIKVYDRGCPTQDSNEAVIRIVVNDPPLTLTPENICLFFREDGSIRLSWKAFEKNRFFGYVLLYRQDPNGKLKLLDTIWSNAAGEFRDIPPQNPKAMNYQYFMVGYNICGKAYDAGMRVHTVREFNSPIDSTYMHYATVEDNSFVKINWFKSREEDFGSYDIFRADNIGGKSTGYRKIATIENINDTTYSDKKVDVSSESYCYRIGVNDKCGHVSRPSNEACNIVLEGEAGHLYFDLKWGPYRTWEGGVRNYELERRVDTGEMRKLANTNLLRVYRDDELDLWWGAYYYVIRAFEGISDSGTGFGASSLSNSIRLIQPPLVFVPNAFSPNTDTYNDVWGVSHAFVKEFRMMVYNRWGEKVWDNDFKGNQWDGTIRGQAAGNDVYIWIVTYRGWDNRFHTQKGTVTVMR